MSCKADSEQLIEAQEILSRAQEKKVEDSEVILQRLSDL